MHRSLKRNVILALAALAVAAFAGGAYAATQSSGPNTRQAFLNDVAKRLHVSPQQLSSALNGATTDQLQAEVKAGQITQAQANALEQHLKNGGATPFLPLTPGLAGPRPFLPGPPGAKGFPARPPGAFGFGLGFRGFGFGFGLGGAASYLGLTNAQLIQQLQSGKSLAQIASSKGKTVAGLEQAMTAPITKALDAAVSTKAITARRSSRSSADCVQAEPADQPEGSCHARAGSATRPLPRPGPERNPPRRQAPGKPYGPPFAMPVPGPGNRPRQRHRPRDADDPQHAQGRASARRAPAALPACAHGVERPLLRRSHRFLTGFSWVAAVLGGPKQQPRIC